MIKNEYHTSNQLIMTRKPKNWTNKNYGNQKALLERLK